MLLQCDGWTEKWKIAIWVFVFVCVCVCRMHVEHCFHYYYTCVCTSRKCPKNNLTFWQLFKFHCSTMFRWLSWVYTDTSDHWDYLQANFRNLTFSNEHITVLRISPIFINEISCNNRVNNLFDSSRYTCNFFGCSKNNISYSNMAMSQNFVCHSSSFIPSPLKQSWFPQQQQKNHDSFGGFGVGCF